MTKDIQGSFSPQKDNKAKSCKELEDQERKLKIPISSNHMTSNIFDSTVFFRMFTFTNFFHEFAPG